MSTTTKPGVRRILSCLSVAVLIGGPLAGSSSGDELWRQAKAYTAAVRDAHQQAVQALEDAQQALEDAKDNLQEAQTDLEEARDDTENPFLKEVADEAAEAVAAAKTAVQIAKAGVTIAEALADVALAGTAIGQGADYLISFCWDPVCPLATGTGTYEYPSDADMDELARDVITGAIGTTLPETQIIEANAILPGSGTAAWSYMRSVTRCFAIALRGAGAYSAGNCPDLLLARDDLQIALGEFVASIEPFAGFLEPAESYGIDEAAANPAELFADARLKLIELEGLAPQFPDPIAVHAAIDLARLGLDQAQAELELLSKGMGDPHHETFDAYAAGTGIRGQGGWTSWNDDPTVDTTVTDAVGRSVMNSLDVHGDADVLHEYPSEDNGVWSFTAWQYIPGGFSSGGGGLEPGSSFMLLNDYDPESGHSPSDASVQMNFDSNDGMLKVYYGNGMNTHDQPYATDRWVELQVIINLDDDWTEVYYDGVSVTTYPWTGGVTGDGTGARDIAAVQLFANGSTSIYYDDITLTRLEGELLPQRLDDEYGPFPPLTLEAFLDFLEDTAVYGVAALPPVEVAALDLMMWLLGGTYDEGPLLSPAVAAWDALGDTGGESALFGPDGRLRFNEVLTTAIDNHWTLIDLAQSPLVQDCLACPSDTDGNGQTDVDDLVRVILDWGSDGTTHNTDVDGNGIVDVDDLLEVILTWGPCT